MPKGKSFWMVIGAVALVPVLALAWWLASPLFLSKTVEEEFPMAAKAAVPANMTRAEVEQTLAGMAKVKQEMSEDMIGAMRSAAKVKTGALRDADSFHKGSGQATIYRLSDGSQVLRLEAINVTNGPDLHVLLAGHPNPTTRADLDSPGYIDLGSLKGNIGSQNYDIPAGVDVGKQQSVIIYCKPFHVIFSVAPLQTAP